jgi:threonine dehydrogenase-like Zn-dependent dehydrogenase
MRAIVWRGDRHFELEEIPDPVPGKNQVVVKVEVSAICGSDLHLPDFGHPPPIVPGHEAAGTVAQLGSDVSGIEEGARVTLDPVQRCGRCYSCTSGIEHLCLDTRHLGSASTTGTWAEQVAIDARNLHLVPKEVGFTAAALTEPAAVCCQSFQRAGLKAGDTVLVLGDGPFGFLHTQVAAALGAGTVICAGHYDERLKRIREKTGALTCNTRVEELQEVIDGRVAPPGVDIAVEATGSGSAPAFGLKALRPRGTLVVFSYIWKPEALDMGLIHMRELNVLGSCRSHRSFDTCLKLMAEGRIDTETLVDLAVPLEDYGRALDRLREEKENTFKVVLIPA